MRRNPNKSQLWNYFDRDPEKKQATCRFCNNVYSYYSTTGNLKCHLKRIHPDVFERVSWDRSVEISDNEDDACEELLKVTDVWNYFDTDSEKRAQCTVCHITLSNEYDELKAHLKDNHPKLLLELLQNKDQDSDAGSASIGDDDNENKYTEIVYLEQEPTETTTKHKEKPKSFPKTAKKRERLHSLYSSDGIPNKKSKTEENDELGAFVKYITCLLKKLPPDVFSNVQIEIINTILKANSQAANTSRSMELINTSSNIITVGGTAPISNTMTGRNYIISLAPAKENETENSN